MVALLRKASDLNIIPFFIIRYSLMSIYRGYRESHSKNNNKATSRELLPSRGSLLLF